MENAREQSFVSAISPPSGERFRHYLNALQAALGCATDAEVARVMDVPASSVANWRRREAMPKERVAWVVEHVVDYATKDPKFPKAGDLALTSAVELLRRTACDPFETGRLPPFEAAWALPAMVRLARLILSGVEGHELSMRDDVSRIADLLEGALPRLKAALRIAAPEVPQ